MRSDLRTVKNKNALFLKPYVKETHAYRSEKQGVLVRRKQDEKRWLPENGYSDSDLSASAPESPLQSAPASASDDVEAACASCPPAVSSGVACAAVV